MLEGETLAALTIRPIHAGDLPGLMALLNGDKKSGQSALSVPSLPDAIRQKIEGGDPACFRLVALFADEIIAQTSLNLSAGIGRLTILVHENHRQRGAGSALLERIVTAASDLALTHIELNVFSDNVPAVALYKKFGFKIEAKNDDPDGSATLSMALPIKRATHLRADA